MICSVARDDRPNCLQGFVALSELHVEGNRLVAVPEALPPRYPKLEVLNLSGNYLERLPATLGRCKLLRHLSLSANYLTDDSFPDGPVEAKLCGTTA